MGSLGQEISPTSVAESVEGVKKSSCPPGLASLNLLNKRQRGNRLVKGKLLKEQAHEEKRKPTDGLQLSTVEIIKLAKEAFLRFPTKSYGDLPMVISPLVEGPSTLSEEYTKNVELVLWLLASAEKFGNQQYDRAIKLLRMCDDLSPLSGSPLERTVYYFARAIREKIIPEAAQTSKDEGIMNEVRPISVDEAVKELQPAAIACQQELPFVRITQFTGIQAVLDKFSFAKRIHFIDFGIRMGASAIVLMQALAVRHECPIVLLKITAFSTTEEHVGDTGKRLTAFASTIGLPFVFKVVVVPDIKGLKEDLFEVEVDEAVSVYLPWVLSTIKTCPENLEVVMEVIKRISPSIMVVTEIEANTDTPIFMERFIEALFLYGSMFDCFGACMDRNNPNRITGEASYIGSGIQDIFEGESECMKKGTSRLGHGGISLRGLEWLKQLSAALVCIKQSLLQVHFLVEILAHLTWMGKASSLGGKEHLLLPSPPGGSSKKQDSNRGSCSH